MNTLKVYAKQNNEYVPIRGAIANFTIDELLDEQLDQARLVVVNSPVDRYQPLTEFRIDFFIDGILDKSIYYLSGESNTITILAPRNNERRYKIDVFLIERTKLLEGILCQSLTFTNAKGKQWGEGDVQNPTSALTYFDHVEESANIPNSYNQDLINQVKELYLNPKVLYEEVQMLPAKDIGNIMIDYLDSIFGIGKFTVVPTQCWLVYNTKGGSTTLYGDQSATVNISDFLAMKYTIVLQSYINGDTTLRVTDTFDIQYYIAGVENRYPLKPYTITDCICRCLELAEPLTLGQAPKYKLQGVTYNFDENGVPTRVIAEGSQADKYDKIIAPNFTMTQCTLREQLKVIGGFIHAEPRLGYDPDGTGSNYEENTIVFEQYEKEQVTNLRERGYIYRGVSQSLNDYCTGITTNVANLVNTINYFDGVIKDPDASAYRTLRTDTINVMISESNAKIQTQFPVYDIRKVVCTVFNADGTTQGEYDITPYVFEAHEYNNLSSYEGTYPYAKGYAIYYTQGQKGLDGLFFKNESAKNPVFVNYAIKNIIDSVRGNTDFDSAEEWQRLAFRITYIPIYSSMFSHGKGLIQDGNNNFTIPYAQSENLTETTYYGEHLKGLANRMGNVQEARTYIVPDITYLPKTGQIIKTEKGDMVISKVSYDMRHTHFKVTVNLTKEFNRLSQYVGVNSHKRISEVSEREAYSRDILIKEYAIVGDNQAPKSRFFGSNVEPLIWAITGNFAGYIPISTVVAAGARKRYFKEQGSQNIDYLNGVALPVISSAFGNAMVFSWTYKDNYSAIESLQRFDYVKDDETKNGAYQTDIPYGDYYGRLYWYDFALLGELDPVTNEKAFADGTTAQTGVIKYPDSTALSSLIRSSQYNGKHNPVLIEKDSREALNFNYEIEYVSNRKDLILGSAIASKCDLIGTDPKQYEAHVYFFKGYKFGKYPRTLAEIDNNKIVGEITQTIFDDRLTVNDNNFVFDFSTIPEFDSWCVAYTYKTTQEIFSDENGDTVTQDVFTGGEITLACNNDSEYYASKNQTTEQIYITISDTNLKGV